MRYVYGPVPSRRLGFSLGVDLVPYKVCSLDCIYCQLGRTTRKEIVRKSYAQKDDILREIGESVNRGKEIDFITFSGSGEPTLNSEIGILIEDIKKITSIPIAVLTNGTLLFMDDVQKNLMKANIVLPSLDAASFEMFQKINRPHRALKIDLIIDGLKRFREFYRGQIWLEIMLVKGFNDDSQELSRIKKALSYIKPNRIHLNTVIRPPSEMYAGPLNPDEMISIKNFFGEGCEIIAEFHRKGSGGNRDMKDKILDMTKRRPITIADISNAFGLSEENVKKMIQKMNKEGLIREIRYKEKRYYSFKT